MFFLLLVQFGNFHKDIESFFYYAYSFHFKFLTFAFWAA
ncbi:hypothetical Protein YC6258_03708 [Gynuella sunshinyii YC6258]|uniref:Uncharacterized protein n=1 Tax=Gynuella sunshinyii YC6258 TaxID=1445510 RepID=A0A0C5VZC1_9GAMM|nr:hypothetical Protein YC6258_03708 [Gynuella sunshinyii YC6258]